MVAAVYVSFFSLFSFSASLCSADDTKKETFSSRTREEGRTACGGRQEGRGEDKDQEEEEESFVPSDELVLAVLDTSCTVLENCSSKVYERGGWRPVVCIAPHQETRRRIIVGVTVKMDGRFSLVLGDAAHTCRPSSLETPSTQRPDTSDCMHLPSVPARILIYSIRRTSSTDQLFVACAGGWGRSVYKETGRDLEDVIERCPGLAVCYFLFSFISTGWPRLPLLVRNNVSRWRGCNVEDFCLR